MKIDDDGQLLVTPDYLKSVGFVLYHGENENAPALFDVDYNEDDLVYVEDKIDRRLFCVVLKKSDGYSYDLYIQDDIGCGFMRVPGDWCELPVKYFEMIFEGVRRERLNQGEGSQRSVASKDQSELPKPETKS